MAAEIDRDLFEWMVGGLLSMVSAVGLNWTYRISKRVEDLDRAFYQRGERIRALEIETETNRRRFDRFEERFDRLEKTLDELKTFLFEKLSQ